MKDAPEILSKAYRVGSLIKTCQLAQENETSGVPHDRRGIGSSL